VTLTKNKMIGEIGRRTRLKNRDVRVMLEALVEVWTEELISGGRIEVENLFVLETQIIDRGEQRGMLTSGEVPRYIKRLTVRSSKKLKLMLRITTIPFGLTRQPVRDHSPRDAQQGKNHVPKLP